MQNKLDWSAYDSYGAGDAYAQIPATGGAFAKASSLCIGSRQCQRADKGVMCPSFRATQDDAHSTRARAAALKAALNGELGDAPFDGPELAAAMDLCVGCKGCRRECPNGVDMALMRTEFLAQRWTHRAMPLREKFFAHLPRLAPWLQRLRWLQALRARVPGLAALTQKLAGIAAARSLPRWAAKPFLAGAAQSSEPAAEGAREVVLLVDTFTNHVEPESAEAAVAVLQAAGYTVHLARAPAGERNLCCGRTYLSAGLIDHARAEAARMLDALWPFVERGVPVLGLEPSCLLMLRDEYFSLGLGERVEKLAKAALLFEEFLAREHDQKRLTLALKPLATRAVVHGHCHQKAFGAMKAMRKVLGFVPGLEVEFIEASCCGMAGSFGFEAEHHDMSMRMAELALLPAVRNAPDAMVIANGTSCRHQIRDGAQRESVHLASVLRAALAS